MRLLLAVPVLLLLLSGCSSPQDAPADASVVDPDAPFVSPSEAGATLPRLRFAAADYEQTTTYDGSFEMQGCIFIQPCDGWQVRFDLTSQVPADAPVELSAAMTVGSSSECVNSNLEVVDTAIQRLNAQQEQLAATLVRQPSGTVTLVLSACGIETLTPNSPAIPVSAQVRTVVRPDVLPAYMPVALELKPGDRIVAMGASSGDIEDLVVIPPGQAPVHLLDDPSFNVTEGMPAGTYVVLVKGADAMLHGPNVTLTLVPIQHFIGEPRTVTSGQTLSWTTAPPGIAAYAGLVYQTGEPGNAGSDLAINYNGNFRLSILQGGTELAAYDRDSCTGVCNLHMGGSFTSTGTAWFPEEMGLGDLEFKVEDTMSGGVTAYEVIAYVALPD